jgi:hypothetical protein
MRRKSPGKVCALCALCAVIPLAGDIWVLGFGPERRRPSPLSRGGLAIDEAEGHQLFENEVDALLAYVAIEKGPHLDPRQASRSRVEGLDDAPSGGIDGRGVEEEAGTGRAVVPHGEGGLEMASVDEREDRCLGNSDYHSGCGL